MKHKVFISYHHKDDTEVKEFIKKYADTYGVFFPRIVGDDYDTTINSDNTDYIMRAIREKYLTDSTITIVMIGDETWKRKYVDWEIASTLRDDSNNKRSGLIGIFLPGRNIYNTKIPERLKSSIQSGYARLYTYPFSHVELEKWIEDAYFRKQNNKLNVGSCKDLYMYNRF